jgi:hypothetical protein
MHPAILGTDDAGMTAQTLLIDDQRPIEEDLHGSQIDHRNGIGPQRRGAHQRLEPDGGFASAGARNGLAQSEPGLRARSVEIDDVTRINQLGISDLVAIELPDLGPQPGRLQEPGGNIPEGVALDDDMLVGRIWRKLDRAARTVGDAGCKPDRASDQPHAKLFDHVDAAWPWFRFVFLIRGSLTAILR